MAIQKSTNRQPMSVRERIRAALHRQPVDRLPFAPLFDAYAMMDLPEDIAGEPGISRWGPRAITGALKALDCDVFLRHIAVHEPMGHARQLEALGAFAPPVETQMEINGEEIVERIITPIGTLTGVWKLTDRVGNIPHFTKYVVNNYEELKIFSYAVDHLSLEPPIRRYDAFRKIDAFLGDDGLPSASITNSPFMYLIEFVCGLANTYLLLFEHRQMVEDILEKLHTSQKRYAGVIAESPPEVVIQYENTSSTLLSPRILRDYCLPYLNSYADIFRQAGKLFLIHMCGKLSVFTPDFASAGRFDGICDIAPLPTGDLPLDEAAKRVPGKVVMGGIDATTFVSPDRAYVTEKIADLVTKTKSFRGVLLGSGDATPRGAQVENFRIIRRLVNEMGTY